MSQFQPGESGNPMGRPRGSVSPRRLVDRAIKPHLATLMDRTLSAALKGDAQAATALVSLYASVRGK